MTRVCRFTCVMILIVAATRVATAQTIGFKGGFTTSTQVRPANSNKLTAQTGYGGGGFIRFGLAGLSLQAEVNALTKGFEEKHESADPNVELDRNAKVSYVEVPLLVRFGGHSSRRLAPYVMAGPAIAFKTGCNAGLAEGTGARTDCSSTIKSTDLGITAATGLEVGAGPGRIFVEGRYTYGLTDIAAATATTGSIKNRSVDLFAGYAIALK